VIDMEEIKRKTDEAQAEINKQIMEATTPENLKKQGVNEAKKAGRKVQRKAEKTVTDAMLKSAKEEIDKRIKGSGSLDEIKVEALKKARKVGKEIHKTANNPTVKSAKNQMMKSVKNKMMKK
jgi:hypothetical protein